MKTLPMFVVLSAILLAPFSSSAYYNPYKPFGTEDNPVYFQEVKSDQQTVREINESINATVQKAQNILRQGSSHETKLLPWNPPSNVPSVAPTYVPVRTSQGTGDPRLDALVEDAIQTQYELIQQEKRIESCPDGLGGLGCRMEAKGLKPEPRFTPPVTNYIDPVSAPKEHGLWSWLRGLFGL